MSVQPREEAPAEAGKPTGNQREEAANGAVAGKLGKPPGGTSSNASGEGAVGAAISDSSGGDSRRQNGRRASSTSIAGRTDAKPVAPATPLVAADTLSPNLGVCRHAALVVNSGDPLARVDLSLFKKQLGNSSLRCDSTNCAAAMPKIWICLNSKCRALVCSTGVASHMRDHFDSQHVTETNAAGDCHCVFVNPRSLTFWCYECGREIRAFPADSATVNGHAHDGSREGVAPRAESEFATPDTVAYLAKVLKCFQGKKGARFPRVVPAPTSSAEPVLPGLVGLRNLGNSCYMNAALQALSSTPALANYFQTAEAYLQECRRPVAATRCAQASSSRGRSPCRLADSLGATLRAMWSGKNTTCSPGRLWNDFRLYNEAFQGYGQQDAQEFLRSLLDKLHEELPYPNSVVPDEDDEPPESSNTGSGRSSASSSPGASPSSSPNRSRQRSSSLSSKGASGEETNGDGKRKKREKKGGGAAKEIDMVEVTKLKPTPQSIISDIFEGVLESRVTCALCKKDYVKEERFYDLSIQIDKRHRLAGAEIVAKEKPAGFLGAWTGHIGNLVSAGGRSVKLQDCLASFCATENLSGDDRFMCTKCKKRNDCQKTLRILRLPETLMIHLKRFRYDSYFSSKITTHVQFPTKDLDMRPFVKTVAGEAGPEITKYDLYALIHHRGGLGGGHYVAYALSPVNNTWYEYDDSYVTAKDEAEVSRLEAYVLFYRRRMPAAREQERQEVLADIERAHVRLSCGVAVPNPVVAGCVPGSVRKGRRAAEFDDPQDAADGDGHTSPKTRPDLVWISRLWFNRWLHMADPGPISNYDFTCPHGFIRSSDSRDVLALVQKIPASTYETLVSIHGTDGSPAFTDDRSAEPPCGTCDAEERELRARRKREEQDILAVDSSSLADGHCWFLISADWLKTWHAFKAGGSDPGRIRNSHFLHADGSPRKRMRKGLDYRGVNQLVWEYFHGIYGGGPACVRGSLELYSEPVPYPSKPADLEGSVRRRIREAPGEAEAEAEADGRPPGGRSDRPDASPASSPEREPPPPPADEAPREEEPNGDPDGPPPANGWPPRLPEGEAERPEGVSEPSP